MSHPSVCPKCKYNRPIALSYCPHCRDLERDKKDPMGAGLTKIFKKMGVQVVTANDLSPKKNQNDRKKTNSKSNSKLKNTKQKKQEDSNMKETDKLKGLQRARNNTNSKAKSRVKSSKTKRKIKNRV